MTTEIERRDEWFEVNNLGIKKTVRVTNTVPHGEIALQVNVWQGVFTQTELTPDEADQLAEMLRLSARGLRGEQPKRDPIEQERNELHKLLRDVSQTAPYSLDAIEGNDFRWALEAAREYVDKS